MAKRVMVNQNVTLNGCIIEVLGHFGESHIPSRILEELPESRTRMIILCLGGELSSDDYQALSNSYKDWRNG